jgi:type IV pilus assembly protein PilM
MRVTTLPLGVDIGATRVRVLEAVVTPAGARLRAVASREVSSDTAGSRLVSDPQYIAALLEEIVRELETKERRCVCAVGEPDALLRPLQIPKMTSIERDRAAKLEAQRHIDFPLGEAVVKVHPVDRPARLWTLGVARASSIHRRLAALRGAGLRPIAIDHESCAFARAVRGYDAVVDIGHQRASVHVMAPQPPSTLQAFTGGLDVTRAIQRELNVDDKLAEKRKRILGTAGAGDRAKGVLVAEIASLLRSARQIHTIGRVAVLGNSARLPGLLPELEAAAGISCEVPVSDVLCSDTYPHDVLRSGAPDWTLAVGLSMWGAE